MFIASITSEVLPKAANAVKKATVFPYDAPMGKIKAENLVASKVTSATKAVEVPEAPKSVVEGIMNIFG